ncbi:hypothetical protein [Nocardia jejuensis]|uniref:hypothetical protein n=1 Tax=Nocardia jejuensis TaxID=328049 RepID=UPI00082A204B|nr:hypothetical protein [Nocardia jejuensis]
MAATLGFPLAVLAQIPVWLCWAALPVPGLGESSPGPVLWAPLAAEAGLAVAAFRFGGSVPRGLALALLVSGALITEWISSH